MGLLVLAIILSGGAITALVYRLGQTGAPGRDATRLSPVRRQTATENHALIWWGAAILLASGAALLMLRLRTRHAWPMHHRRPQPRSDQQRVRQLLELLLERNRSASDAETWTALLSGVELLQRELDAQYHAGPGTADLSVPAVGAQHILDALPIGILQVDTAGDVRYVNAAAARLLQLRNGHQTRLQDRLGQPALVETILNLRHHVGGAAVDCRFSTPAGPVVARLSAISPGPARDDVVIVAQDISELKQAERTRDEFLAHLTHELRTPLTNIQAYAETLKDDFFDDEKTRRECYEVIAGEARRLAKLIEDVLSVSQIDAGAARLTRTAVRIDDLLRDAAREIQAAADAKGIDLTLDIPAGLPPLHGDRFRLQQVWANLLNNAVKFTPPGGAVKAAIEADLRVMRLTVADTGIGIASRWHKLIFEKFFRVQEPSAQVPNGPGLGLALVRDIVRLHGGSVKVDSAPGCGARFTVELPIMASTTDASADRHSAGGEAT
jgi:signal transduction histidine kinase